MIEHFKKQASIACKSKNNKKLHFTLRKLAKDKEIKVCSFDKGNGIVILNASSYEEKIKTILNDGSKFIEVPVDNCTNFNKHPVCVEEEKIKRYLNRHVKNKISKTNFENIVPNGSDIAKIYATIKVHKPDKPARSIVSTINTATYNLGKYLNDLINRQNNL